MMSLQLTKYASAVVSWESRAACVPQWDGIVRATVDSNGIASDKGFVSIEAFVPRGARAEFGLLGFAFEPNVRGTLEVVVGYTEKSARKWAGSLASAVDTVRVGLPRSLAEAVVQGACDVAAAIPSGVLTCREAAYGEIGSSPSFLRKLAKVVAELAVTGNARSMEGEIATRLRSSIVEA